jgi:hypothetical protein
VILFDRDQLTGADRNVTSPGQVRQLVADLRTVAGPRKIIVSTDQEGGVVTRLGPAHGFPPVASQAEIGPKSATRVRAWADGIASTLADAGLNLNFAPVVDLNVNPDSPAIGALHRSFSADPTVVARDATIEVDAHRGAKVRTTLKHFPGIGSSTTNTDFGVADVTKTWSDTELEPYRGLIASGHVDLVGRPCRQRPDRRRHPASLTRKTVTDVLRGQLGWDGVVVTDDLRPPRSPRPSAPTGDRAGARGRQRPAALRQPAGLRRPHREPRRRRREPGGRDGRRCRGDRPVVRPRPEDLRRQSAEPRKGSADRQPGCRGGPSRASAGRYHGAALERRRRRRDRPGQRDGWRLFASTAACWRTGR